MSAGTCYFLLACLALAVQLVHCEIDTSNDQQNIKSTTKTKCSTNYNSMCLKLDIISLIENISKSNEEYNIFSGISVVKEDRSNQTNNMEIISELAREFPDNPDKRLDGFLVAKLTDFIQSYSLRMKFLDIPNDVLDQARYGGGGGGGKGGSKGGKKGGMEQFLAAAMMMKGTLGAMAMAGIAMLAGKALMTGLMALTLSAIIGLKSLTSGGSKKTTYEIVAKPVYSHSQSHSTSHEDHHGGGGGGGGMTHGSYGGFRRSLNLNLPDSVLKA